MEISLIIISFLIHSIVLIAIYSLYKQVQQKNENSAEVMKLFETYLQEVKAENERLQKEILRSSPQENNIKSYNNYPLPSVAEKIVTTMEIAEENNYHLLKNDENMDYDLSLQAQILQLYEKGYKKEDIARKLDCGKTEVELFIKLYNKKLP